MSGLARCTGQYKELFLLAEIRVKLFISRLGLEGSLGRLNLHPSQSTSDIRTFFHFKLGQHPS